MADIKNEKEIIIAGGLGNATPSQVLEGVSFTSEGGFMQTGTMQIDDPALQTHLADTNNPHGVTKSQVGLDNVDNTADADKPVSTPQQEALNALKTKLEGDINTHKNNKSNPHGVNKEQIGLSNVDNTADVDKPLSRATQEALNELENEVIITAAATGERITVENSAEAGVREFAIGGKTEQFTTKGYQLLDLSGIVSKTAGGGTITNNGDGSITISGSGELTATCSSSCIINNPTYLKEGNITLDCGLKTYPVFNITIRSSAGNVYFSNSYTVKETKKLTADIVNSEDLNILIDIYGSAGNTITPCTIKPMLYQDGDGTWEPFTGGKATPNPEYQQDITGVGDNGEVEVTVTGKNLLNIVATSQTVNGLTFTVNEDKTILVNGTAEKHTYIPLNTFEYCEGKYILSGCPDTNGLENTFTLYDDILRKYDFGNGVEIDGQQSGHIYIRVSQGISMNNVLFKPMIRKAEIEYDTYEPYKSKTIKIPVSSPLYEGDYVRLKNRKSEILRENAMVVFDGSDDECWEVADNVFRVLNFANGEDVKQTVRTNSFQSYKVNSWANMPDKYCMNYGNAVGFKYSACKSLAEWKNWIAQNPITIVYRLAEPTTETIDTDIDLSTYNQITNFTNSDNANMEVEYFVNSANGNVVYNLQTQLNEKAPVDSPTFKGDVRVHSLSVGNDIYANSISSGRKGEDIGLYSVATGWQVEATKRGSSAFGANTKAYSNYQNVIGRFNVPDAETKYIHIIGGGTSEEDRKNVHTVDWDGNAEYAGDVKATDANGNIVSLLSLKNFVVMENTATGGYSVPARTLVNGDCLVYKEGYIPMFANIYDINTTNGETVICTQIHIDYEEERVLFKLLNLSDSICDANIVIEVLYVRDI